MNDQVDTVKTLLKIISRQQSISTAGDYIADNLEIYLDDMAKGGGMMAWCRWVSFLQFVADQKMSNLELHAEKIVIQDDLVTVVARWHGIKDQHKLKSNDVHVRYQIEENYVSKVWSYTENYTFILGDIILHKPFFELMIIAAIIYSWIHGI